MPDLASAEMPMPDDVEIPSPNPTVFADAIEVDDDEVDAEAPDHDEPEDLEEAERRAVKAGGGSAVGGRMLEIGLTQRGVCETGQNGGVPLERYVRPFWPRSGPQPWCAFFVSWCYWQTALHKPYWDNPGWVESVHAWAASARRLVKTPERGDMFGIGGAHMGLVVRRIGGGRVRTLEGNTSSGCVKVLDRPQSGLWFARPTP